MNNPKNTGIVTIEDLPIDVSIDIDPNFKAKLFSNIIKELKEWSIISKKLDLSYTSFFNGEILRKKCKPLYFFKRICNYLENKGHLEFSVKNLGKNIIYLKSNKGNEGIRNPKLPFNFNSYEGGCFISATLHDGSIKTIENMNYCNKERILREKIINISKKLFGGVHYLENKYTIVFPKIIGEILINCLGMKKSKKSVSDTHIPEFLLNNPKKEAISGYLNFAISDDGSVGIDLKHNIYRIRINLAKDVTNMNLKNIDKYHIPALLIGNKKMLEKLSINVNKPRLTNKFKYKDKKGNNRTSLQWEVSITNLIDIEKFYENVVLTHSKKQEKLDKIMEIASKTRRQTRKGNVFKWSLEQCKQLETENLPIKASILSRKLKRSLGRTQWILKKMVENNLMEKIGKNRQGKEYSYRTVY